MNKAPKHITLRTAPRNIEKVDRNGLVLIYGPVFRMNLVYEEATLPLGFEPVSDSTGQLTHQRVVWGDQPTAALRFPSVMAIVTGVTIERIPADILVNVGKLGLIIVAICTREDTEVAGVGMAGRTGVPNRRMVTAVYGEIHGIVIKGRWYPCAGTMTFGTISREQIRGVVRVVGAIVFRHMAGVAVRWGSGIPVRMTLEATGIRVLAGQ